MLSERNEQCVTHREIDMVQLKEQHRWGFWHFKDEYAAEGSVTAHKLLAILLFKSLPRQSLCSFAVTADLRNPEPTSCPLHAWRSSLANTYPILQKQLQQLQQPQQPQLQQPQQLQQPEEEFYRVDSQANTEGWPPLSEDEDVMNWLDL